jgi:cbb3-type cytochrome c oxidase subunit III
MCLKNSKIRVGRAAVLTLLVMVVVASWLSGRLGAREKEPYYNAEAAKLKNPVPPNPESIEAGKKLYQRHCASCHGRGGKGDGGQALSGGEPSDLTDDVWDYGSTDGEIFVAIRDGLSTDMLAYKDKLKEKETWQVVIYVRSLSHKQPK